MLADVLVNLVQRFAPNPHYPMQALSYLASLGSIVCWIIVLIKLFKEKGALHGILGIISCGLYPFIWGWIHANRLAIKNIMLAWTACWVLSFVLYFLAR